MTIRYQEERYQMKAEDIILINPGVSYEIENTRDALYGVASFPCALQQVCWKKAYDILL